MTAWWTPDPEEVHRTAIVAFAASAGRPDDDYDALWHWSVEHLDDFWLAVWRYFGVQSEPGPTTVLATTEMPGATWFPGVRLNYVTHVFRDRDPDATAVVELTEAGGSTEVTWAELERQVSAAAATLRRLGVGTGDRVVGYLPNGAAAIVAFLASASLGAVWSCCGPDYAAGAAANRLAQLEPKVLVAADGYHFAGRAHDRRDEAVRLSALLPTLTDVLHLRHLGLPPAPYAVAVTEWADAADPALLDGAERRSGWGGRGWRRCRCRSTIRSGCCTRPAPPACPRASCTGTAAWCWSTSRPSGWG